MAYTKCIEAKQQRYEDIEMKQEIANLIKDLYDLQDEHFTVFINVQGHVDLISIQTFRIGWSAQTKPTWSDEFYISNFEILDEDIQFVLGAAKADKAKGREWLANAELRKQEEIKQLKAKLSELEKSK